MSNKSLFLCICIVLLYVNAFGQNIFNKQNGSILDAGFVGGTVFSNIPNSEKIIISEPYFLSGQGINYTFVPTHIVRFRLGAFINYSFHLSEQDDGIWFVYAETAYSGDGTQLKFNSPTKDYHYNITFNYQFANLLFLFGGKIGAVSLGIGPELGLNVAPSNITFSSGGKGKLDAFGTDAAQGQQLRNSLSGKSNFGVVGAIGCQVFPFADAEVRYHYGLKDIIEVQPNAYNWVQAQNHNNNIQILVKFYLTKREKLRQ